jgi:hypothetical protein
MEALQKMIEALSSDLKTGLTSVESKLESTQASVDATANTIHTLNAWRMLWPILTKFSCPLVKVQ